VKELREHGVLVIKALLLMRALPLPKSVLPFSHAFLTECVGNGCLAGTVSLELGHGGSAES